MAHIAKTTADLEAQMEALRKKGAENRLEDGRFVGLGEEGVFDEDIYSAPAKKGKFEGYVTSIGGQEEEDDDEEEMRPGLGRQAAYKVAQTAIRETAASGQDVDPMAEHRRARVIDRENDYQKRRQRIQLSPDRLDPFADERKSLKQKLHSLG